jgi:hypothetical protein
MNKAFPLVCVISLCSVAVAANKYVVIDTPTYKMEVPKTWIVGEETSFGQLKWQLNQLAVESPEMGFSGLNLHGFTMQIPMCGEVNRLALAILPLPKFGIFL